MDRHGEVRYFESFDGVRIAYAISGDGPPLVLLPSWLTHLDFQRRSIAWGPLLKALSGRFRLVRYDPRGCGLSDRSPRDLSLTAWVRDLDALIAHLDLSDFSVVAACQGGAVAIEYAARNPGKVSNLVLFGTYARGRDKRGDIPLEQDKARVMLEMIRVGWGADDHAFATAFAKQFQPDGGEDHLKSWCELQRRAATPAEAVALTKIMFGIDIRTALTIIGCSTLVVHASRDAVVPVEEGRLLAKTIPNARYLELDSPNHFLREGEPAWQQFTEALYDFLPKRRKEDAIWTQLTSRERDVLEPLAGGLDNHQIADILGISEKTVRNHVSSIFATLGVTNRSRLIVAAREAGFGAGSDPGR